MEKIRSHTLQEGQEFERVFLLYGKISFDTISGYNSSRYMTTEMCTLRPISSAGSPVRAASASILAPKSPKPPIDSGPKRRMMAAAPAAIQVIIGIESPLTALVACS